MVTVAWLTYTEYPTYKGSSKRCGRAHYEKLCGFQKFLTPNKPIFVSKSIFPF